MKLRYVIISLILFTSILVSCNTDTTVYGPPVNQYIPTHSARAHYLPEATDFAVSYLTTIRSPDTALVIIPDSILNLFLYPLARLYDGQTGLPILEPVITQLGIHKYLIWSVRTSVTVDTSEFWVKNVINDISPTGNATIDSLVDLFKLQLGGGDFVSNGMTFLTISHPPLNSRALARAFLPVAGVHDARATFVSYAFSDIQFELYSEASIIRLGIERVFTVDSWSFSLDRNYHIDYLGLLQYEPPPIRPSNTVA